MPDQMFQSRYRAASHFRLRKPILACDCHYRFNLVIERLLISGPDMDETWPTRLLGFNLVIERLLISGFPVRDIHRQLINVSISLSSGFSFQARCRTDVVSACASFQSRYRAASHFRSLPERQVQVCKLCFNLVIERLLISGSADVLR